MASNRSDEEAGNDNPVSEPAAECDDEAPAPTTGDLKAAADDWWTTHSTVQSVHEEPVIPSGSDDPSGGIGEESDAYGSQGATDPPELSERSGSVAGLRERTRAAPRRMTFEVLEIDSSYEHDDGDLHLTEYELEQQHQNDEEERRLLSPSDSGGAKAAGESADAGPTLLPSIPAQCLHVCAKLVLTEERSSAKPIRVGNVSIFAPSCWYRTGWGMLGPHWFGPLIVAAITSSSGWFFFHEALRDIGSMSAAICAVFTFATLYHLANASLRDPGVVNTRRYQARMASASREASTPANDPSSPSENDADQPPSSDAPASPEAVSPPPSRNAPSSSRRRPRERWCDYCQASQPPDGAHCLDCGVCVAGYDHHCVWMGTCIGKGNFRQFVRFNLCWLAFLGYAVVWVSILGPKLF
jgi:DHHC palmitoyltransferase